MKFNPLEFLRRTPNENGELRSIKSKGVYEKSGYQKRIVTKVFTLNDKWTKFSK